MHCPSILKVFYFAFVSVAHADAFACRQFDYLEEKVPSIQATPEEVSFPVRK